MDTDVVRREDRALEGRSAKASEELARHRWHWTLDDDNPERMSIRAYARLVERSYVSVQRMAKGYAVWRDPDTRITRSLADCIEAADLGAERQAATEAVAEARGATFANVAANRRDEVTSTLGVARERAERRGTSVEEEVRNVAQRREQGRRANEAERRERKRMGLSFIRYEAALGKAARSLRVALEMGELEITDEERDLLLGTLANVRSLLELVELRIAGSTDVDWDAELGRLGG